MSERFIRNRFLKPFVYFLSFAMAIAILGFVRVNADTDPIPSEIDLYYLDDEVKAVIGNLPSGYSDSYTIDTSALSGTPSFSVYTGGSYIAVSSDGVITTKQYSNYVPGQYSRTCEVRVKCGTYTKYIKVNLKDYAEIYADNKTDSVLNSIIKSGMTDLQKLTAITKWVAQNTDYGNYSSYQAMMIFMKGDCWASSFTIVEMCSKVGIQAIDRSANRDSSTAGSGHRNAIALCDGKYYVAEAGYSGTKPRYYDVTERPGGFSANGSVLYQYDGFETDVVIPEKIGGTTITQFGDGKWGVVHSEGVKSIKLSKSIKTIAANAFSYSNGAVVTVDSSNPYFTESGDVLYTKDKTKLIYAPTTLSSLSIDKNTTEIGEQAFSESKLKKVVIPGNVKTIGIEAFSNADVEDVVIEEGVTTVGESAFRGCSDLNNLSIPSTLKTVGEDAFYTYHTVKNVYYGGTEEQWKANGFDSIFSGSNVFFGGARVTGIDPNGDTDITFTTKGKSVELNAKVIPSNAVNQVITYTSSDKNVAKIEGNVLTSVGEGNCTITAVTSDGGFSATYNVTVKYNKYKLTIENGYTTKTINGVSTQFTEYDFIEGETFGINNKKPSDNVVFKQWILDDDVTLTYGSLTSNYIAVKLPARNVTIKAQYEPILVTSVYVNPQTSVSYLCPEMTLKVNASVSPSNAYDKSVVWSSTDTAVATVDNDGNITAVAAGTCKITATAADGSGKSGSYSLTVKDHTWDQGTVTKEATCEEAGSKTYTCTHAGCGKTKTETIDALGHSTSHVDAKSPTKTEPGNIEHYKCTRCGKLFADKDAKQPLSEADVMLPALGHELTKVEASAPTCDKAGNTEYYICKDTDCGCGRCYSDPYGKNEITLASTVINATGHKLTTVTGKAAKCEEDGVETYYKCTVCNKLFSDKDGNNEISKPVVIPALGHDVEHVDAKEPTYDDIGWIEHYVCKRCGKMFADKECKTPLTDEDIYMPCKKHVLTKVAAVAPTCTKAGNSEYYICKDDGCGCGKLYEDKFGQKETSLAKVTLAATGHSITEVPKKDPKCTETGNKKHWKCTKCGHLYADESGNTEITKESVTIDALGHDWDEGSVTTEPGCETPGIKTCKCKRDGCKATKTESVDPAGHDKEHLKHVPYKAATRDNDGNKEYYECPGCGKKFSDKDCTNELTSVDIIIPAIGAAQLGEEGDDGDFRYKVTYQATDGTGTVTLVGVVNPAETVSIPATAVIKETTYIVNRIGTKAFYNNKTIKTLFINSNIVTIDNYAFYGCSNLIKVSGGYRLRAIGSYAFAGCPRLTSFKLTSKVLSKIGYYCFKSDSRLKTIYIKSTTKLTKKSVKKSLKGSKVKTVKVKKSKVKKYKKFFTKKNCGRRVKVKK